MKCKVQRSETWPHRNQRRRPPTAVKKQRRPRRTISVRVSKNATCFRLALSSICSHNYTRCQRARTGARTKALCYMPINKVIKGHLRWRGRSLHQDSASVFRTHKKLSAMMSRRRTQRCCKWGPSVCWRQSILSCIHKSSGAKHTCLMWLSSGPWIKVHFGCTAACKVCIFIVFWWTRRANSANHWRTHSCRPTNDRWTGSGISYGKQEQ